MGTTRLFLIYGFIALAGCRTGGPQPASTVPLELGVSQQLPCNGTATDYWIDEVGPVASPYSRKSVELRPTDEFKVRGWCVDRRAGAPAAGVELVLDGKTYQVPYKLDRSDVADAQKNTNYRYSGFQVSFPAQAVGVGSHRISFRFLANDKKSYYQTPELPVEIR